MYHLLTGHNPSEPPYEMYPITYWDPNLSSGLEKIVAKCTQPNPEDRFQTAKELMEALKSYDDLDTPMIQKYRKILSIFILLLIVAVGCGGIACTTHVYAKTKQQQEWINRGKLLQEETDTVERGRIYDAIVQELDEIDKVSDSNVQASVEEIKQLLEQLESLEEKEGRE